MTAPAERTSHPILLVSLVTRLALGLGLFGGKLINKALEKNRDLRYQYASEIRADLKRLKRETDSGRIAA